MALRSLIVTGCLLLTFYGASAQTGPDDQEGTITFRSSQHIYVKFNQTENLNPGDTLFVSRERKLLPVLVIEELSSVSCVCRPLAGVSLAVNDKVVARRKQPQPKESVRKQIEPAAEDPEPGKAVEPGAEEKTGKLPDKKTTEISGRLTVASYSGLSNTPAGNSQKMRYTLNLDARNMAGSKLSAETYLSFVHRDGQWEEIKDNLFRGLKIYSLAASYSFGPDLRLWLGRKINPRISSVGAIDGLQIERRMGSFSSGLVTGFRPAADDYGFDARLLQFGAYLAHDYAKKNTSMQSTLAVMEQQNAGLTDRRFAYLQHHNTLLRNLYFFGSLEADLYRKTAEKTDNTPRLVNTYLSLRYRMGNKLSLMAAYNARENIIYYETYRNYLDRLLEDINQRGYTFRFNCQPSRKWSVGATAAYRTAKNDPRDSKHLYAYVSFPEVPRIRIQATLSATILETSYLNGRIYGLAISRDIIPGKLSGGMKYSYVDYRYNYLEEVTPQQVGEIDLHWRIIRKLTLSAYAEGIFEEDHNFQQIYLSISKAL